MKKCGNDNCNEMITVNHDYCHNCASMQLRTYRDHHPRAMKLMNKLEEFLVVKCSESYALQVMLMIKTEEQIKGTWTEEDEAWAREHLPEWTQNVYDEGEVREGIKPRNATEKYLVNLIHDLAQQLAFHKYVRDRGVKPYTDVIEESKKEIAKYPYRKDDRVIP